MKEEYILCLEQEKKAKEEKVKKTALSKENNAQLCHVLQRVKYENVQVNVSADEEYIWILKWVCQRAEVLNPKQTVWNMN